MTMRDRKQAKLAPKKLQLKTEILRKLNKEQMSQVVGGAGVGQCIISDCCCTGTVDGG
jgi:hypothetical protein